MGISFLNVLNASISASWLVLAVLGLRLVLKKAPKAIHCALWALVAIRLLCPFSIQSPVSLMPSSQTISPDYLYEPDVHSTAQTVLEIVDNPVYPESVSFVLDTSVSRVSVWDIQWSLVWIAGVGIMGLYALISWLRLRRRVSASIPIGSNIRLCDYIDSPFILGIFRPLIYLPSDMDQETMDHVLAHEKSHLLRRDHWWKPLGFGLLSIHWFNPLMWAAYILLCRDIELACDERVIRDLTADRKKAYSTALLRCSVSRHQIAACPLAFGETGVKERVKNVLNYKKPAFWVIFLAMLLSAAVAVCFLTDPLSGEEPVPLPVELENGTWVAQKKVYWPSHSSFFVHTMEMEVQGDALMLRFNRGEGSVGPLSVKNGWQEDCPMDKKYRDLLSELTGIAPEFGFTDLSDCSFLVLDENHFLVQRFGNLYVVAWRRSNIGLEIIDYIFHVVPESKAPAGGVLVIPETDTTTDALIRKTILNFNHIDFPDPYYAFVSFYPVTQALGDGPDGSDEQIYAAARIGLFRETDTGLEEFNSRIFMFAIFIDTPAGESPRVSSYWQSDRHSLRELSPEFTLPVVNINDAGKYEQFLAADCLEQMEAYLQRCSVTIDLGTATPDPDPVGDAIRKTILAKNPVEDHPDRITTVSYAPMQHVVSFGDPSGFDTIYMMVRIVTYEKNEIFLRELDSKNFEAAIRVQTLTDANPEVTAYWQADVDSEEDLRERFGSFPDDTEEMMGTSMMELELECVRQAALQCQMDCDVLRSHLLETKPEYARFNTDNGIIVYWQATADGINCVITECSGQLMTAEELDTVPVLSSLETYLILRAHSGAEVTLINRDTLNETSR